MYSGTGSGSGIDEDGEENISKEKIEIKLNMWLRGENGKTGERRADSERLRLASIEEYSWVQFICFWHIPFALWPSLVYRKERETNVRRSIIINGNRQVCGARLSILFVFRRCCCRFFRRFGFRFLCLGHTISDHHWSRKYPRGALQYIFFFTFHR